MRIVILIAVLFGTSVASAQTSLPPPSSSSRSGTLTSDLTTTSQTTLLSSPGTNNRYYLYSAMVTNSDASVSTDVTISCGDGADNKLIAHAAFGGGFSISLPSPIRCDRNTAITITAGTTSAQLRAVVTAFVKND